MKLRYVMPIVVGCLGAFSASAASITNGSFETPVVQGTPQLLVGNTSMTGWTVVANDRTTTTPGNDVAEVTNGSFGLLTPFGNQFMDLTGYADSKPFSGVAQTVATLVGQAYDVSFWLGASLTDRRYQGPVGVTVSDGTTSGVFTLDTGTSTNIDATGMIWTLQTFSFTASSASTLLSFIGEQAGNADRGGQFIGLDNVSIADAASAAPEPASWAMMIAGFGAIGFALRRSRKAVVRFA